MHPTPFPTSVQPTRYWSLNRVLSVLIAGGFLMLFVDIRHEHASALREETASWIPVIFTAVAVLVMLVTIIPWRPGWRATLTAVYAASLFIGVMGVYFHMDGKPERLLSTLFAKNAAQTLTARPAGAPGLIQLASSHEGHDKRSHKSKKDDAPILAPLAFAGLGLIGLTSTSRRLRSE